MRFLNTGKSNSSGPRLSVTLKTQNNQALQPLSDLRKNLQDKTQFQGYVRRLMNNSENITASDVDPLLDTISIREAEIRFATVTGWATVNISNCAGVSDESIRLALKWLLMPIKVEIFNFQRSGEEDDGARGQFQVDSLLCANRMKRLQSDFAVLYTCQKIGMRVSIGLPIEVCKTEFSGPFADAVQEAIMSRYDYTTRTLDLTRFHASPELAEHFCPLHVEKLLENVLFTVSKSLPQVSSLVLANNYLCSLKAFEFVGGRFENLERLDISANKIIELVELKHLRQHRLQQLFLAGNGVTKYDTDQVREVLPTLKDIHGCVLPKAKKCPLPSPQRLQSAGTSRMDFCLSFVAAYYSFFDDPETRSELVQYYNEDAMFSLSVSEKLNCAPYRMYNRNHKNSQSTFARSSKLQLNNSGILLALSRLPRMETDYKNASIDVQVSEKNLCIFTVTGNFLEKTDSGNELRYFQRMFGLRPIGCPGWLLTNDMLCIITTKPVRKEPDGPLVSLVGIDDCEPMLDDAEETFTEPAAKNAKANNQVVFEDEMDPPDPVMELSMSMPKMALSSNEAFDDMPPLVPIDKLVVNNEAVLENEIDDTVVSDDESYDLVIDEDVLIGEDF
ncbi:uncharacterized protein Dana_GF26868 [Drosophila ananassae]|uniref:NTF2 domain-containing protein n=1 Tax=Drosophila ananassae TaxID=7217 RepID=A0A0N8P0Y9_DROAN|nr:nuclear RNA export factor 1 [Drosophila ananassae]KPU78452.1 uncharacterized protein Dana_GF26868 [Drosophila ananassae]